MRNTLFLLTLISLVLSCSTPLPISLYCQWSYLGHWKSKNVDIPVDITIHPDNTVTGSVGDAVLKNCIVKSNRGAICRKLNMKTDFIITNGFIEGKTFPDDNLTHRTFTIPFNLEHDQLVGSIMITAPWTYPKPFLNRLKLQRVKPDQ